MLRLLRTLALLFALAVVALGAGFAGFVAAAHRPPVPPPAADGIVVLTGGAERVETGLRLLAADRARLLLVSGVAGGAGLGELLHRAGLGEGAIEARITLGRTARTTAGNAEETAEWAKPHGIRSLIVVTAGFHMPRALLELHRALPAVTLYPVQVQPQAQTQAMGRLGSARVLAVEYLKLLGAWAGLSQIIRQPLSIVGHTPVGNSVNG